MMKKLLGLILLFLFLGLVGCGLQDQDSRVSAMESVENGRSLSKASVKESVENLQKEENVEVEEEKVEEVGEVASSEPEKELTEEEDSSLADIEWRRVSESFARSHGGIYVKKGENLYGLYAVERRSDIKYGRVDGDEIVFYRVSYFTGEETDDGKPIFQNWTAGEIVPVIQVDKENDLIVGYSKPGSTNVPKLRIGEEILSTSYTFDMTVEEIKEKGATVTDSSGEVIPLEEIRNLEEGQEYIIFWYEGTVYKEERVVANSLYFRHIYSDEAAKYELTKDGYVIYDLSTFRSGGLYGSTYMAEFV